MYVCMYYVDLGATLAYFPCQMLNGKLHHRCSLHVVLCIIRNNMCLNQYKIIFEFCARDIVQLTRRSVRAK